MVQGFSGCRTLVTLLMHQIIDKILSVFRPGAAEHLHQDVSNSKNVDRTVVKARVLILWHEHLSPYPFGHCSMQCWRCDVAISV
jgi:hypothetical protein